MPAATPTPTSIGAAIIAQAAKTLPPAAFMNKAAALWAAETNPIPIPEVQAALIILAAHEPAAMPGEPNPKKAAVAPTAPVAAAVAAAAPIPAVTATGSTPLADGSVDGLSDRLASEFTYGVHCIVY